MATFEPVSFNIRLANKADCKNIMSLIQELAEFEHMSENIRIGAEELERDGFEGRPWFQCVVAECTGSGTEIKTRLVGYAMFYYVFSSFRGRSAFLEDIYVTPSYRGQSLGTRMLRKVAQIVLEERCCRLDFIVLEWNNKAANLYRRLGAEDISETEQWHLWRFQMDQLKSLVHSSN